MRVPWTSGRILTLNWACGENWRGLSGLDGSVIDIWRFADDGGVTGGRRGLRKGVSLHDEDDGEGASWGVGGTGVCV